MRGRISTFIIVPLICIAAIIGAGAFYSGATVPSSGNPNPQYQSNQTFIGANFFTNLNGFIDNINKLGSALQRITPTQGAQFTDLTAYVDTGVAIIKILLSIPMLIITFVYDVVNLLLLGFLPTTAPPAFLAMIAILTMIPIVYAIFEIAALIRNPGVGKL